ncbi:hypothetical protein QFZ62_000709 [Clavibacter sp. B3I6]|uniref:hypothetical protein n=1 Tax=Clavibacter sp. B3I6 TaxID=3042268 RepID=UPI00277DC294|nr:hypothetical protein [Clavibacter sp. B3I6]MDQ0743401.1 hypothetical protein [Clavibacter sp. B3I6]
MTVLLIALNVLALVLPAIGFLRLLTSAHRALRALEAKQEARGFRQMTRGELSHQDPAEGLRAQVLSLRWDVLFVLMGLLCGAAANLIPLVEQLLSPAATGCP